MNIIKKYELIGEATYFWGKPLYRIMALCNINDTSVKAGDLGGLGS